MADRFLGFDELITTIRTLAFDRPPAFVCNAHITGLGVARALADHDVPVIALDRTGTGVAPYSDAVVAAGQITYPLDDPDGFRADIETLAELTDTEPVAFACMDEWVHTLANTTPTGVRLPFATDRISDVLNKEALYRTAHALDIPYPETYRIAETHPDAPRTGSPEVVPAATAADILGFPLVVKPALKREFEEALGTNVIEVSSADEFEHTVNLAQQHGIRVMAQERVRTVPGEDRSYVSYTPKSDDPIGIVGRPVRYPAAYGTSCYVERDHAPTIEDRARTVLAATGYHGISEAEFIYDTDRDDHVLLDINTRPWKWIGLPVHAGANLPYAAYADATNTPYTPTEIRDAAWVYLRDYLALCHATATENGKPNGNHPDPLAREDWHALLSGGAVESRVLTTAVYSPTDPGPASQLLANEISDHEYYCAC